MYNWSALCSCLFRFDVVGFTEDAFFTACGCSPCPSFVRCFIGTTSLSSPFFTAKNHMHIQTSTYSHTHSHTLTQTRPHDTTLGQAFINLGWTLIRLIAWSPPSLSNRSVSPQAALMDTMVHPHSSQAWLHTGPGYIPYLLGHLDTIEDDVNQGSSTFSNSAHSST